MFLLLSTGVHYLTDHTELQPLADMNSVFWRILEGCTCVWACNHVGCSSAVKPKIWACPERESITSPWCVVTWMLMWANEQAAIHRKRPDSCFVTLCCSVHSSFYFILQFTQFFLLDASLFLHQHLSHAFPKMLINLRAQVWTCCMQLWAVHIIYYCDIHQ